MTAFSCQNASIEECQNKIRYVSTASALSNGHITPVQQMVSSGTGAIIVSLFMTPLDVVKIRLQAQDRFHQRKCFLYSNGLMDHYCVRLNGDPTPEMLLHKPEEICNCKWYNRPKYFNGTVDAMLKISKLEGPRSLWSGLSPTLVLAVPNTIIYFTTYEQLRHKFSIHYPNNDTRVALLSGALARIWACTIVSPLELIRTKMQSQKMAFYQVRQALSVTLKSEGIKGLWKGYTATLLRDVPFSAMYWGLYETLRPKEYNFQQCFVAGAVSGTVASTITLPMDVIKTRLQIDLGEKLVKGNGNKNHVLKSVSIAKEIVRNEGTKGLFSGLTPRLVKVAPACAIMISSYEYCKLYFTLRNKSN